MKTSFGSVFGKRSREESIEQVGRDAKKFDAGGVVKVGRPVFALEQLQNDARSLGGKGLNLGPMAKQVFKDFYGEKIKVERGFDPFQGKNWVTRTSGASRIDSSADPVNNKVSLKIAYSQLSRSSEEDYWNNLLSAPQPLFACEPLKTNKQMSRGHIQTFSTLNQFLRVNALELFAQPYSLPNDPRFSLRNQFDIFQSFKHIGPMLDIYQSPKKEASIRFYIDAINSGRARLEAIHACCDVQDILPGAKLGMRTCLRIEGLESRCRLWERKLIGVCQAMHRLMNISQDIPVKEVDKVDEANSKMITLHTEFLNLCDFNVKGEDNEVKKDDIFKVAMVKFKEWKANPGTKYYITFEPVVHNAGGCIPHLLYDFSPYTNSISCVRDMGIYMGISNYDGDQKDAKSAVNTAYTSLTDGENSVNTTVGSLGKNKYHMQVCMLASD